MKTLLTAAALAALASLSSAQGSTLRYYVRADAPGNGGNGTSWNLAFKYLQDALDEAETTLQQGCGCVVEVWVKNGIYYPDRSISSPMGNGNRSRSFEMINDCRIYGGFLGNETALSQRDLGNPNNRSVLSGAIGSSADTDNTLHVVDASFGANNDAADAVLDGFRIRDGYCADQTSPNDRGPGLKTSFGRATVANCIFEENTGTEGGAASCDDDGRLRFVNCHFFDNHATDDGGAYFQGSGGTLFVQCVFEENRADDRGGAITHETLSGTLGVIDMTSCAFWNNTAPTEGTDILVRGGSTDFLTWNTIFWSPNPIRLIEGGFMENNFPVIRGGAAGASADGSSSVFNSNLSADDPGFLSSPGRPAETSTNSGVVDAGTNSGVSQDVADLDNDGNFTEATPLDFAYKPRFSGVIDRGPYEAVCATESYCVGLMNSTGSGARLNIHGSCRISDESLTLTASPVPNQPGIFFYGNSQTAQAFGNGIRCVGGFVVRMPVVFPFGGLADYTVNWSQDTTMITPGSVWNFQLWYRDPAAGGANFNLSDAIEVTFQP